MRVEGSGRQLYELLAPERLEGRLRDPIRWGSEVWYMNDDIRRSVKRLRALLESTGEDLAPRPRSALGAFDHMR
jgi:hypothetical protein